MRIGILGCGFVADLYMRTLASHPALELVAAADHDPQRARAFAEHWQIPVKASLEDLLRDESIRIIVNLTNPRAHYELNRQCLNAGRHVYCEKPLAMTYEEALELVELAESRGLQISAAPCSVLGETAQTLWKALREKRVGPVRLVYAEMDDDLVPLAPYRKWISESGAPWPWKDEFEIGCTLEHAGYYLTWLAAFFGPAESVTAVASLQYPDKCEEPLRPHSPDFSVAVIRFADGVVCRLTCSLVAPHDHALTVVGDRGLLGIKDCWFYREPVKLRKRWKIRRRMLFSPIARRLPLQKDASQTVSRKGAAAMDFMRGVAELADAVDNGRTSRLSPRFSLHVTEMALAIHNAGEQGSHYRMRSRFEPMPPMPWAR